MELENTRTSTSVPVLLVAAAVLLSGAALLSALDPARVMESLLLLHSGVDYHEDTTHSLLLGGYQSVLCARNTGIYVGAMLALVWAWGTGRGRAQGFPSLRVALVLALLVGVMIADGVNSVVAELGYPSAYQPSNPLRLATGLLAGAAVGVYFLPVLNGIVWKDRDARSVLPGLRALGGLVLVLTGLWSLLVSGLDVLAVPLALLTTMASLVLFGAVNLLFLVLLLKADNRFTRARNLATFSLVAVVAALGQMMLLAWFMRTFVLEV